MTNRTRTRIFLFVVLGFAAAVGAPPPDPKPGVPNDGSSSVGSKSGAPSEKSSSPGWKSYSYPADGFKATFPSAPDLQKKDVPTDAGSFQLRSYIAQDSGGAMFVAVCDYGSTTATTDVNAILQSVKNGALQNSSSHLLSEKKIALGENPGLEFEGQSESAFFTFRVYLVGSTLYQILVITPLGKPYANTARFFDSFQLIPKTTN